MASFQIWYMRPEYFGSGILGTVKPDPADLERTHIHLRSLDLAGGTLDRVYHEMQGEMWSPNGEARGLILGKGLRHTSMSVGDVIVDQDGATYVVAIFGFDRLA